MTSHVVDEASSNGLLAEKKLISFGKKQ